MLIMCPVTMGWASGLIVQCTLDLELPREPCSQFMNLKIMRYGYADMQRCAFIFPSISNLERAILHIIHVQAYLELACTKCVHIHTCLAFIDYCVLIKFMFGQALNVLATIFLRLLSIHRSLSSLLAMHSKCCTLLVTQWNQWYTF